MNLPEPKPHRLKKVIQEKGIKLWQLRILLNDKYAEPKLSRFLNGVEPMPEVLVKKIETAIR